MIPQKLIDELQAELGAFRDQGGADTDDLLPRAGLALVEGAQATDHDTAVAHIMLSAALLIEWLKRKS